MVNIVYIDDQMFSTPESSYEDFLDIWRNNLKDVSIKEFELFLFDDPESGINKIKSLGKNTIVLLDIQMDLRKTDGAEVLKKIRDENVTCPVIGYSGNKNSDKNQKYLIPLLENDLFGYVQKKTGNEPELIETINKAIEKFKDNIPLELGDALNEYLDRNPQFKSTKVTLKRNGENKEVSFSEIQDHMNKGTTFGKDYQKAIYKIAFEDFKEKKKVIK